MNWQMRYDENEQIIFIKTNGILEITSANYMRAEGAALIKEHNCMRLLLDHSGIVRDALSTMEIYDLPRRYEEMGLTRQLKMALVIPHEFVENLRFYETVCRNNGYSVQLFSDHDLALKWLKE
ncbi:MAG: hypothetical protein KA473_14170 [Anaerolineales bacterium]|nr:hypothetical protein [Anaerolineales bacterium]MBP6210575.1 hypothetical protein [Anaerolineales bacterium]MBP8164490.1 hypothetical protein [Anaerolineales bacterium]